MPKLSTYGYESGLLSNSMLQAAITCPLKYKLLYLDKIVTNKDGEWFDASFIGNIVHETIETHEMDLDASINHVWDILGEYFPPTIISRSKGFYGMYEKAVAATQAEGAKWGREYKAPTMTGFWKKNYGGLDKLLENLDKEAAAAVKGHFSVPYHDLFAQSFNCLKNWQRMKVGDALHKELLMQGVVGESDCQTKMVGTADRIEGREGGIALCDYKTGEWGYSEEDLANSDQFGLYDHILTEQGYTVLEWTVYDLRVNERVTVKPTADMRQKFQNRLNNNLRYFKQLSVMFDKIEVGVPAGSHFKTGCPCIAASTGDCHFYAKLN